MGASSLGSARKLLELAIRRAVADNTWDDIGVTDQEPGKGKGAYHKAYETTLTLYGVNYRVVVIHSDAHDKRRRKKPDKRIFVLTSAERRSPAQPLTSVQMVYPAILEIAPEVLVTPPG